MPRRSLLGIDLRRLARGLSLGILAIIIPPMAWAGSITGFSPLQGKLGTLVTIAGTGLKGTTQVTIGGVAATGVTVVSDTQVTATMGALTKTAGITLTGPYGTISTTGSTNSNGPALGAWGDGKIVSYCDPFVHIHKSFAIRDVSVINDDRAKGPTGAWSFNFLMSQIAPSTMSTSLFIKKWLKQWQNTSKVNGFSNPPPQGVENLIKSWPRVSGANVEADGTLPLDLNSNQFQLVAILFRPDLTKNATNIAGEGRFIFRVGNSVDEVIFEYKLPINVGTTPVTDAGWMNRIFLLTQLPFGNTYNTRLQSVTDLFSKKTFVGVAGMVNGSAINQVRTNAINLEGPWRLREFRLTPTSIAAAKGVLAAGAGELVSWSTKGNPSDTLDTSSGKIEAWVLANRVGILSNTPPETPSAMWGGGTATGSYTFSTAVTPAVNKMFSMTTCRGCHDPGTNISFNSGAASPFLQASISGFASFMTGTTTGVVANAKVGAKTAMPGGFSAPFTPNSDGTVKENTGYSDLHARAHNLISRLITGFCQ